MDKTLNILTIVFQLATTFILTVGIYMLFALLDSDFGFDGLVGLLIFQPIMGAVISILTIFACFIVGLPIRLNKTINKWWADNFYISIIGTVCGLIFLFLATLPHFSETVSTEIDGQQILKQIPNSFLSYTGWFLTAFMTLHIFPPDTLKIRIGNFFRTTFNLAIFIIACLTLSQCNNSELKVDKTAQSKTLIVRLIQNADELFGDTLGESAICSESFHYLGELKNDKGEAFLKIMTYEVETGTTCHYNTKILVYSKDEKYLGYYYTHGMPVTQLMDNGLFIDGKTVGNFLNGIPDSLDMGDNLWAKFEKKNGL